MAEPVRREFFGALDALRGVAALLVVFYHLPPWLDAVFDVQVIRHGYLMVNFFFVLSGFVLFHSYANRLTDGRGFLKFALLRFSRLYPIHLLFVVPFVIIELGKYLAFIKYGFTGSSAIPPSLSNIGSTLAANLFLIQGLGITSNHTPFNFPNWSISTEFYTYLIFGLGLVCCSKQGFRLLSLGLVVGCVGVLLAFGDRLGDLANMPRCVSGFFFGCLTRAAFERLRGRTLRADWPSAIALASLVLLALPWKTASEGASWFEQLTLPIAAALIVSLLLTPSSRLGRLLQTRPLRYLGEISYSLYMSHALVQWIARQACKRFEQPTMVDGLLRGHLSPGLAILAYVLVTVATLLVARLSYLAVEAPLREAARRRIGAWLP